MGNPDNTDNTVDYTTNRWSRWRTYYKRMEISKRNAKRVVQSRGTSSFPNKCGHGRQHR